MAGKEQKSKIKTVDAIIQSIFIIALIVIVVFMIIALIAFCVGAGIGVSMVISDDGADVANNTTHIENVTHEMTTNLTDTNDDLAYDSEKDESNYLEKGESNLDYSDDY